MQVPASQENVVVVKSARSDNSKHAHEDILSLVDNQVNESLKRLLPQMLTESLKGAGLASSDKHQPREEMLTSQKEFPRKRKKAMRGVMILFQVHGLVGSIVNQIT